MAITVKEAQKKLLDPTLSKEELQIFIEIEKYVDREIERQYSGKYDTVGVFISADIVNFDWLPNSDTHCVLRAGRKALLKQKLIDMYKQGGWKIEKKDYNQYEFSDANLNLRQL